jgi:hypothetical protein
MFEEMTLEELKTILETKTSFKYEIKKPFSREEIFVLGLKKSDEISVAFSNYYGTQKRFVGYSYNSGTSGGGGPCDTVEEVISAIERIYKNFGYEGPRMEQLTLF